MKRQISQRIISKIIVFVLILMVVSCGAGLNRNIVETTTAARDLSSEGLELYKKMYEKQFTKCGDSYYTRHHYQLRYKIKGDSPDKDVTEILRLLNVKFKVEDASSLLGNADRLNGNEWRGIFTAYADSSRSFIDGKGWGLWSEDNRGGSDRTQAWKTKLGWEFSKEGNSSKVKNDFNRQEDDSYRYLLETFEPIGDCKKLPYLN